MSEATSNVEFAHKLHEQGHHRPPASRREAFIEIIEAIALAIVAITTAWSGYQAAKWDAQSAARYTLAARTTVRAQEHWTLAGQDRLYDVITFNGWIAARTSGNAALTAFYERRFRPEYAAAFQVWMKLDPFNNVSAPASPIFLPEYKNANAIQAAKTSEDSNRYFEEGVSLRETGDKYVKITVFLATVLLLTAVSQKFQVFGPRMAVLVFSFVLLIICTYWLISFPRA